MTTSTPTVCLYARPHYSQKVRVLHFRICRDRRTAVEEAKAILAVFGCPAWVEDYWKPATRCPKCGGNVRDDHCANPGATS